MPEQDYLNPMLADFGTKLRDIEERQRILKDRVLLIGQNLVEIKETLEKDVTSLKVQSEETKSDILKIKAALQRIIDDLENKARKEDVEILRKQARMFNPLELVRMEDFKKIIKEKG